MAKNEQSIPKYKPTAKKKKQTPTSGVKPATYRIGIDMQSRVKETAKKYNVTQADLVTFLLKNGLDSLEDGSLKLTTVTPEPKKLKISM